MLSSSLTSAMAGFLLCFFGLSLSDCRCGSQNGCHLSSHAEAKMTNVQDAGKQLKFASTLKKLSKLFAGA